MAMARHQDSLYEATLRGGGDISEDTRTLLSEKCDLVKSYLAPEKSMADIDTLAIKLLQTEAEQAIAGIDEEVTFIVPEIAQAVYSCHVCGNRNQQFFVTDQKQGDTICLGKDGRGCGTVVLDHKPHEGNMYRQFEGEEDRSHHGLPPDRLYSSSYNSRTQTSKGGADSSKLANLSGYIELNLSQMGRDDKRTRVGYKDQMKKKAFDTIDHIAANCDLHKVVTDRAKELFATWRNVKEHVQQRNAVICACVVAAYRTVAVDELQAQEARRKEALARAVTRCIQCGNRDETLFLSDEEDASKKVCGRVPNDEGGEKCGGRVELVIPDITASDTLYPFSCAKCDAKFNTQKALDVHRGACPKQIAVGDTVSWRERGSGSGEKFLVTALDEQSGMATLKPTAANHIVQDGVVEAAVSDLVRIFGGAPKYPGVDGSGMDTPLNEWSVDEARQWLTWVDPGDSIHVISICAELENVVGPAAAANAQPASHADRKRKRTRTAGQVLQLWNSAKLVELCGGNATVGEKFHAAIAKKRNERQQARQSNKAMLHAQQRHNQLQRRPWVQHVARVTNSSQHNDILHSNDD